MHPRNHARIRHLNLRPADPGPAVDRRWRSVIGRPVSRRLHAPSSAPQPLPIGRARDSTSDTAPSSACRERARRKFVRTLHSKDLTQELSVRQASRLRRAPFAAALLGLTCLAGIVAAASTDSASPLEPTDNQQRSHWLYLPAQPCHEVDVFCLCPSECTKADPSAPIFDVRAKVANRVEHFFPGN